MENDLLSKQLSNYQNFLDQEGDFERWCAFVELSSAAQALRGWELGARELQVCDELEKAARLTLEKSLSLDALRAHYQSPQSAPKLYFWRKQAWWPGVRQTPSGWAMTCLAANGFPECDQEAGISLLEEGLAGKLRSYHLIVEEIEGDLTRAEKEVALRLWLDGLDGPDAAVSGRLLA